MPEWIPSTDFEDDSPTIQPELEYDSTFEDYENDLGVSLFDRSKKNDTNNEIPGHCSEVNVDKKNKYNKITPHDLEGNDNTEYEILAMIRDYGMGPSAEENLNSSRTIAAISSARPYEIAGIPILYDEDLFKLQPRKSNSKASDCKSDKLSSTDSHKLFNAEEKTSPNISCAGVGQNPANAMKSNKIVPTPSHPKPINRADKLASKSANKIPTQSLISQEVCPTPELVPSTDFKVDTKQLKSRKSNSTNISCTVITHPHPFEESAETVPLTCLPKLMNITDELTSSTPKNNKPSSTDYSLHKVAKIKDETESNISYATHDSKPKFVGKPNKIAKASTISQNASTKSCGWVPSTGFEDDIIPEQLESDAKSENFEETFLCPIETNHMNKEQNYETPDFSRKLSSQDLDENNTAEYEILAMIRSHGMASSVDENLNSSRTIPPILSNRSYTKSAIPILFDEDFFKLKPRQSSSGSSTISSKSDISSSTDCSLHRIPKNVEEPVLNTSGENPPLVLEPREIESLPHDHKAINGIHRQVSKLEKTISTQSQNSKISLVRSTNFEDYRKDLKPQDSNSKSHKSLPTSVSSHEVIKDDEGSALDGQNPILVKANKIDSLSCSPKPKNDGNRRTSTPHKSSSHLRGTNPPTVKRKEIARKPCLLEPLNVANRLNRKQIQAPIPQKVSVTYTEWVPQKDFEDDIIPKPFDNGDNFENYENDFMETIFNAAETNHTNIGPNYEVRDSNLNENIAIELEILSMIRQQGMTPSIDENLSSTRTIPAILNNRPYTKSVFPILYEESYFKLNPRTPSTSASDSNSEMSSSTDCLSDEVSKNEVLIEPWSVLQANKTYPCQCLPEPLNGTSARTEKLDKLSEANCSSHDYKNFDESIAQNKSLEPNKIDPISCSPKVEYIPDKLSAKSARKIPILTPRIYRMSAEVVPDMNLCDISAIPPECKSKCVNSLYNFTNRNVRRKLSIEQNCEIRDPYRKVNIIKEIKYNNGSSATDKHTRLQMPHQDHVDIDTTEHKLLSTVHGKGITPNVDENMNNYGTDCSSQFKSNMCMSCTALSPNRSSLPKPSKIHLVQCFPEPTNTPNWLITRTRTIIATEVNAAPAVFLTFFLSIFCCFLFSVLLNI